MAFIKGHEFIVRTKSGIIFNIYLNEKKYIESIRSNREGMWKKKHIIFNNITESLNLHIDDKDHIHMVSYNENGRLYYHLYSNNQWTNHLIGQFEVENQRLIYPIVRYVNNQIHIFYYLIQAQEKNQAYLLHIKFKDGNYSKNNLTKIGFNKYINPFKILIKDNKIMVVYASLVDKFEQVFVKQFNMEEKKWGEADCLTSSKVNKIYLDGLMLNKDIHLVWSNYDEEFLTVQYSKLGLDRIGKDKLETRSLSSPSSSSFPTLVYYKDILWAIWTEMGKIVSSYSINGGNDWSQPYIDEESKKFDFKRYRYLTNREAEGLGDFIFATTYPKIQFLGFGGDTSDEIPPEQ